MDNPFKKRATEFIDEPAALISLSSHEPLKVFFDENAGELLFEKLVTVVGTPGSGKTTIARLIELDTLMTLIRSSTDEQKDLIATFAGAGILQDLQPSILAYRIPVASNLRDIWELPYSSAIRFSLLRSFLQAKTVLGWLRKLEKEEVKLSSIVVNVRENKYTEAKIIFAHDIEKFRDYARRVEENIFRIITALVPPPEEKLAELTTISRYDAFNVIDSISAPLFPGKLLVKLRPLMILDDAHELHQEQFNDINEWLRNRELGLGRWLMTRVDAINSEKFRAAHNAAQEEEKPGTTMGRDEIMVLLQHRSGTGGRSTFKRIANDISRRYIAQMSAFRRKPGSTLEALLDAQPQAIAASYLKELGRSVDQAIEESRFTQPQIVAIKNSIPAKVTEDERLMLTRILVHRQMRRAPQTDMFADEETPESEEELFNVKPALIAGANIQLLHEFGKPFYFGLDRLSDASDDNIEQFINLAGALVDQIETKVLRGRQAQLDARTQHQAITERAVKTMKEWDFPRSHSVKKMITFIATKCVEKTLAPNAPLDDGANAFGVPQAEMEYLERNHPVLLQVLHYALAYNAISMRDNYKCKGRLWCLIRLGGLPIIEHKLTFSKGGFCEGHLSDLAESIAE